MPGSEPLLINVKTRLLVPVGGGRDEARRHRLETDGWYSKPAKSGLKIAVQGHYSPLLAGLEHITCQRRRWAQDGLIFRVDETGEFVRDVQNKPGNSSVPGADKYHTDDHSPDSNFKELRIASRSSAAARFLFLLISSKYA